MSAYKKPWHMYIIGTWGCCSVVPWDLLVPLTYRKCYLQILFRIWFNFYWNTYFYLNIAPWHTYTHTPPQRDSYFQWVSNDWAHFVTVVDVMNFWANFPIKTWLSTTLTRGCMWESKWGTSFWLIFSSSINIINIIYWALCRINHLYITSSL